LFENENVKLKATYLNFEVLSNGQKVISVSLAISQTPVYTVRP